MKFEAKKKALSTALSNVAALSAAVSSGGDDGKVVQVSAGKGKVKFTTNFAEVTVPEVTVAEEGDVVLDMPALSKALSLSGEVFSFSHSGENAAHFRCGRAKGPVGIRSTGFDPDAMKSAPKQTIIVNSFKDVLSGISSKGADADRTIHFQPEKKQLIGESTDGDRGIVVVAEATSDVAFAQASLVIPAKAANALTKMIGPAVLGFNDNSLVVRSETFKAVVPLSTKDPFQVYEQLTSYFAEQKPHGSFTVPVKSLKAALDDAVALMGSGADATVVMSMTEDKATIVGKSEAGPVEVTFDVDNGLTGILIKVRADLLRDCLLLYQEDVLTVTIYMSAMELSSKSISLKEHRVLVPLQDDVLVEKTEEKKTTKPVAVTEKKAKKAAAPKAASAPKAEVKTPDLPWDGGEEASTDAAAEAPEEVEDESFDDDEEEG